jgi:hypothetical protein
MTAHERRSHFSVAILATVTAYLMAGGIDAFAATSTYGLVVQSVSNFRISGTGLAPSQSPALANQSSFTSVILNLLSTARNLRVGLFNDDDQPPPH